MCLACATHVPCANAKDGVTEKKMTINEAMRSDHGLRCLRTDADTDERWHCSTVRSLFGPCTPCLPLSTFNRFITSFPRLSDHAFLREGTGLKFLADNHKAAPTGLWFGGETRGQRRGRRLGCIGLGSLGQAFHSCAQEIQSNTRGQGHGVWRCLVSRLDSCRAVNSTFKFAACHVPLLHELGGAFRGLCSSLRLSPRRLAGIADADLMDMDDVGSGLECWCGPLLSVRTMAGRVWPATPKHLLSGRFHCHHQEPDHLWILRRASSNVRVFLCLCSVRSVAQEEKGQVGGNCTKDGTSGKLWSKP